MEAELKHKKKYAYIKHLLTLAEKVKMGLAILSCLQLFIAFRSLLSTNASTICPFCLLYKTTSPHRYPPKTTET